MAIELELNLVLLPTRHKSPRQYMTDASTVSELAVRPDPLDRLREDRVRAHTLGQSWQAHRLERGQCRLLVCVAALVAPAPGRPRRSGPSHSRRRLCSCPDAGRPPDGLRFPTGMRLVSAISTTPTPWFWGINGAAGVLAASLAVATSVAVSIDATLRVGAACYLLVAAPAVLLASVRSRPSSTATIPAP
jgi:hypothetical protein